MFEVVKKTRHNHLVTSLEIKAERVAKKARIGQFIMLRIDERGERIPLTIASLDREAGTVGIIFLHVGYTTTLLSRLEPGDFLLDFVGPLGRASDYTGMKKVCVVGGGLGVAIAYPQAKAMHELGIEVDFIVGFKNQELIILGEEFAKACARLTVMTDDGSNGNKGFVTAALAERLAAGAEYDTVVAFGPMVMMKAVCDLTRGPGIRTIISMNPLMVDGTGMCGCCRITVGGETKFACVDGPDFDGHQVDFAEAIARSRMYAAEERMIMEQHECRLGGGK